MEEKIKIYIPRTINDVLINDMEKFMFYKKDGRLNKNAFLNTLIINYHEQYQENLDRMQAYLQETLTSTIPEAKDTSLSEAISHIMSYMQTPDEQTSGAKMNITLSLKPTKASSGIISYLTACHLQNQSLSSYFRKMLSAYVELSQDKRERIIFKDRIDVIEEAIAKRKKIFFVTPHNKRSYLVSPYIIARSSEELFNYLLCVYRNKPYSFRISKVSQITILNEASEITKENKKYLKQMQTHGPQFAITSNEDICVHLTPEGHQRYLNMYVHRPIAKSVVKTDDGYDYHFACSEHQVFLYFLRFGADAYIAHPQRLTDTMHDYYARAYHLYKPKP